MKKRVLITGSSGMLGIDLCHELRKDYEICGVDLVNSPRSIGHRFWKGDITNKKNITDVITKAKPDFVVHTAALTDVDGCERNRSKAYKVNAQGAANVALACKKINVPLIYISTDFVFDGKKRRSYKETDKPYPLSIYADSKLKGEGAVRKTLKNYFILRTSWLYGKHGKNFVDTIFAKARTEKILKVVDDQTGCPTYTKDLAKAIHVLLNRVLRGPGSGVRGQGIYHVSNSGGVSWYKYAKEILRLAGSKAKVVPISSKELDRPAERPAMSILDNNKFKRFTGYAMRGWKAALKDYLS